jgi:hypothetical protein
MDKPDLEELVLKFAVGYVIGIALGITILLVLIFGGVL